MIGVLGGSFDPIHNGHLQAALEVQQRLGLEQIIFIPCQQHAFGKLFKATALQRLNMLQLALEGKKNCVIDTRELHRPGISYTVDTLVELNAEYPNKIYSLIIGMDALHTLNKWHQWEEILELANIIVVDRPGIETDNTLQELNPELQEYLCADQEEFMRSKSGKIFLLDIPLLDISATDIRSKIAKHENVAYLLPKTVADYIATEKIYS